MNERVTVEVPPWVAELFDRGVQAALILVAVAAVGFAALGLGWSGVAARLYVALQMPYVASGAVGGVALAGAALGLLGVHLERRSSAADRVRLDAAIRAASDVTVLLPSHIARRRRVTTALVHNGRTVHRHDCRMAAGRDLPALSSFEDAAALRACRICDPFSGLNR